MYVIPKIYIIKAIQFYIPLFKDNEKITESNVQGSPVAPQRPKRKQSIEDCSIYLAVAAMGPRRTKSAELEAQVPRKRQSRWSATEWEPEDKNIFDQSPYFCLSQMRWMESVLLVQDHIIQSSTTI